MARRLRQVTDLYINGKVAVLKDGTPLWVQVLNPFEQDTARNEAQIAKARLVLAIKEHGSDEQTKVKMFFFEEGVEEARRKVIDARVAEAMPKILERLRNDPEWTEKLAILERGLDDAASPAEPAEIELLEKLANEYSQEVGKRLAKEREFLILKFADHSEDALWAEYLDWYLGRRGAEIQLAEYRLHQMLFGVRWCEATQSEDGAWDHAECNGHDDRLFVDKEQVRRCPEDLLAICMAAAEDVEMTVREAKNSRRQGSSSVSSPLPSEGEGSTASSRTETPAPPAGSSTSPSPTPSLSSATAS
jgi:hypothetical protein